MPTGKLSIYSQHDSRHSHIIVTCPGQVEDCIDIWSWIMRLADEHSLKINGQSAIELLRRTVSLTKIRLLDEDIRDTGIR